MDLALRNILRKQFSLRCVVYIACVRVETGYRFHVNSEQWMS